MRFSLLSMIVENLLATQKVFAYIPTAIANHYFNTAQYKTMPLAQEHTAVHLCLHKTTPLDSVTQYIQVVKELLSQ